jgi:hypothetical protein
VMMPRRPVAGRIFEELPVLEDCTKPISGIQEVTWRDSA